jgi:hypothetical protein
VLGGPARHVRVGNAELARFGTALAVQEREEGTHRGNKQRLHKYAVNEPESARLHLAAAPPVVEAHGKKDKEVNKVNARETPETNAGKRASQLAKVQYGDLHRSEGRA